MAENKGRQGGHGPGGPGARGGYQKPKDAKRTMLRLMKYISGKKWLLVIVFLCVIISSVASIAGTYLIRPVLNELVGGGSLSDKLVYLAKMLAVMACVFLLGAVCTYAQSAIMAQLAHRGTNKLRAELFDKMQDLPLNFYDKHTHGELMSRFSNDADYVQQMLEQSIVSVFSSALLFVGIVAVMLFTCAPLFLVTLFVLAASFFAIRIIGGRSRKLYQRQQQALGEMNGNIQEMIEGLRVVKAFTHEDAARARFDELNDAYFDVAKDANFYATAMMPIVGNVMNIGYAITSIVGGLFAFGGILDLGGLAVYLQYGRQVSQPMSQVSQQMTALLSALAGAERIFEIIDMQPEVDDGKVTLVRAQKDENGAISENTGSERYHTWAWKVPRSSRLVLVPVMVEPDGSPVELGQAVREGGALRMLPPNEDSPEGIWVRAERDGTLTEVTDLASLASHGWAWKYPDRQGSSTLHIIRGSVRNVPGEDYCLTELKGAVRLNDVCFSYVPEKPILKHVSVYANPGQKILSLHKIPGAQGRQYVCRRTDVYFGSASEKKKTGSGVCCMYAAGIVWYRKQRTVILHTHGAPASDYRVAASGRNGGRGACRNYYHRGKQPDCKGVYVARPADERFLCGRLSLYYRKKQGGAAGDVSADSLIRRLPEGGGGRLHRRSAASWHPDRSLPGIVHQ